MTSNNEQYQLPRYLLSSKELLDSEVGAVEIGKLEPGAYEVVKQAMEHAAQERGVLTPAMVADIIFKAGIESEVGSTGNPYTIRDGEQWEAFVHEVPEYCGENVPSVYMVDGAKYTTGV